MCTLLDYAENKGVERGLKTGKRQGLEQGKRQGLEQGKRQGLEQGKRQGLERGIQALIEAGLAFGQTYDSTMNMVMEKFSLDEAAARKKMRLYWKGK